MGESFDVVKHDYRPCPIRKLRQRLGESRLQLRILRGITKRRRQSVAQLFGRPYFPSPCNVERGIGYDSIQPRRKSLRRIEPVDCLPCSNESFLDCVFRVFVDRYDGSCNEVRALLVQAHEAGEGLLTACACSVSQRALLIWDTHRAG